MNKILLFSFILLFSCNKKTKSIEYPQEETFLEDIEQNKGKLTLLNPIVDAGIVQEGEVITGEFFFINESDLEINVNYVNPDCTCTDFNISKNIISPLDTLIVKLVFDTDDKLGKQSLVAVVNTNSEEKFHKIRLKMQVES